ncbi:MAG TPA: hypothetical protein VGM93_10205, partial [Acidimicrobiales bacterium]
MTGNLVGSGWKPRRFAGRRRATERAVVAIVGTVSLVAAVLAIGVVSAVPASASTITTSTTSWSGGLDCTSWGSFNIPEAATNVTFTL